MFLLQVSMYKAIQREKPAEQSHGADYLQRPLVPRFQIPAVAHARR